MGAEQHKVSLTIVNNLFMIVFMIRTFADAQTERFFYDREI